MSDWQKRAIERRDERHTAISDEPTRVVGKKKDTKTWCRGKDGVEHVTRVDKPVGFTGYSCEKFCINCGKVLERYISGDIRPKPVWVIEYEKENE